jgi:hypothetical protein
MPQAQREALERAPNRIEQDHSTPFVLAAVRTNLSVRRNFSLCIDSVSFCAR